MTKHELIEEICELQMYCGNLPIMGQSEAALFIARMLRTQNEALLLLLTSPNVSAPAAAGTTKARD